jgi:hypothetical protein
LLATATTANTEPETSNQQPATSNQQPATSNHTQSAMKITIEYCSM